MIEKLVTKIVKILEARNDKEDVKSYVGATVVSAQTNLRTIVRTLLNSDLNPKTIKIKSIEILNVQGDGSLIIGTVNRSGAYSPSTMYTPSTFTDTGQKVTFSGGSNGYLNEDDLKQTILDKPGFGPNLTVRLVISYIVCGTLVPAPEAP